MGKIVNPVRPDDELVGVRADTFIRNLADVRMTDARVDAALRPSEEMPRTGVSYFLSQDAKSGFGITGQGELIGLFSTVKGRCHDLIESANAVGAQSLDCFDGFLPAVYAGHGYIESRREPNWTPGGPDVVYMIRVR